MENLGFRFRPSHQECALYLAFKVTGSPFPSNGNIPDRDPYNSQDLAGIFMDAEKNGEIFFFTKLRAKGKSGSNNANRTVGKGTWHGDRTEPIEHNGRKLGKYTKLSYEEKGSIYDRRFTMTEYILPKNTKIRYDPFKHYVLCHLEKNERWINGKRVSKSTRHSMMIEIADRAHHVATAHSMELRSDQICLQPISDQQPLAMEEEAAGFQNVEILDDGDSQSLVQIDSCVNGPANDPLLCPSTANFEAISYHNSPYQYSREVGYESVPFQAPPPAAVLDNGSPPIQNYTLELNPLYPEPQRTEAPLRPNDHTPVAQLLYYPAHSAVSDRNSVNQSESEVGSQFVPLQTPNFAAESNYFVGDNGLHTLPGYINREYRPNNTGDKTSSYPEPPHPFDESHVIPDHISQSESEVGSELVPFQAPTPAAQPNTWTNQEAYCQIIPEDGCEDNDWLHDYLISMDYQTEGRNGQEEATEKSQPVPNTMPEPEPINVEHLAMEAPSKSL